MRLNVMMPLSDLGGDPGMVREFAQAAEEIGFVGLGLADHVLGVNRASRPDWGARNTSADLFHDPFVAFAFLTGCCRPTTEFSTQVLILAQRQAVLVAKQAASLDLLCGGRFRLGVGVGWNPVEFTGLNENFHNRGRRSAEQVAVMQRLWAEEHVTFEGKWHRIEDAGVNARPASGRIPVWFGGHVEQTLERIATLGDGWIMNAYPPGEAIEAELAKLRALTLAAGRPADAVGLDVWMSPGAGDEASWVAEAAYWKAQGAAHITLTNTFGSRHHRRIPGRTLADHLAVMRRFHGAVAAAL
jgi:probable F420-dependent oxidoreductase